MSPKHKKRLLKGIGLFLALGTCFALVMYALSQNLNLFYTPSELLQNNPAAQVRLGGLVKSGSVKRGEGLSLVFTLTDNHQELLVQYHGILPDLFKEGQGIVALGHYQPHPTPHFVATQVLAKHDENYMPPELKAALEEGGSK
jgi:cytochrome c-type biogenesis protein CcmE